MMVEYHLQNITSPENWTQLKMVVLELTEPVNNIIWVYVIMKVLTKSLFPWVQRNIVISLPMINYISRLPV